LKLKKGDSAKLWHMPNESFDKQGSVVLSAICNAYKFSYYE